MDLTHWRRALAAGALLALPASAQEAPAVIVPPGGTVPLPAGTVFEGPAIEVPPPSVERPGLFGWRRRHADKKRHYQEHFLGYPEEFNEWPLGQTVYTHGRTMAANGRAARMILNEYDFVGGETELNDRGQQKLAAIEAQLPVNFAPLIVEQTAWDPSVAEARRVAILNRLARGPFPVPEERVVVGPAISNGLIGKEAYKVGGMRQKEFTSDNGGGSASGLDGSGVSNPVGGRVQN